MLCWTMNSQGSELLLLTAAKFSKTDPLHFQNSWYHCELTATTESKLIVYVSNWSADLNLKGKVDNVTDESLGFPRHTQKNPLSLLLSYNTRIKEMMECVFFSYSLKLQKLKLSLI